MFSRQFRNGSFLSNFIGRESSEWPFDHLIVFKPTTQPIHYYFLAAWVNEPNGIKSKEEFVKYLNEKLSILNANNKM